jgi:hypothetical protein
LKIGPVRDGARIDNSDVRTFSEGDDGVSSLFESIDKSLRLELVHLTSECGNRDGGHSTHYYLSRTIKADWGSRAYLGKFQIPNSKYQINPKHQIQMTETITPIIRISVIGICLVFGACHLVLSPSTKAWSGPI